MKPVHVLTLDEALDAIRSVCKRAPKPDTLSNRLDFLQAQDDARLLGPDLDDLTVSDIDHYIDESGGRLPEGELAYFLPRMCALMASGQPLLSAFGWDESFCFLSYSDFPGAWPDDRVRAMTGFCAALVVSFIQDPDRFSPGHVDPNRTLGTMLCAMMRYRIDTQALLDAAESCDAALLAESLAHWISVECHDADENDIAPLFDHYWSMVPEQPLVAAWVSRHVDRADG